MAWPGRDSRPWLPLRKVIAWLVFVCATCMSVRVRANGRLKRRCCHLVMFDYAVVLKCTNLSKKYWASYCQGLAWKSRKPLEIADGVHMQTIVRTMCRRYLRRNWTVKLFLFLLIIITKNTASDPFLHMDSRETKKQTRAMVERVSSRAQVSILTRLSTVKQRSHSKVTKCRHTYNGFIQKYLKGAPPITVVLGILSC